MSDDNVIELAIAAPDPNVIAIAERLLAEAKAGKIRAISYVTQLDSYEYASGFEGEWSNNFEMLGNLDRIRHRFNLSMDEQATTRKL